MTKQQNGFLMPTVVVIFGVCIVILLAVFQYVITTTNLASQVVYRQVALTAARGALDYGKDQFDANVNYNGTAETTMFTNGTYRVTYELYPIPGGLSADGRTMRAQGIGRVYLPADGTTARYSRTINGEIIRSQIVAGDPSDFSPLAWYDAQTAETLIAANSSTAVGNPTSLREERNNGNYCNGSPQTTSPSNNKLDITKNGECGSSNQTDIGLMFNLASNLPKGVTITNATLKFTASDSDSQAISVNVKGIDADNYANFTTSSTPQLQPASRTSASVSWAMSSWTANASGAAQTSPNISSVIQEVIDRPGWSEGNNIGFVLEHAAGGGKRRARTTGITLSITYAGSTQASDGSSIMQWNDRSGNGFHLLSQGASGTWATKSTIAQAPVASVPNGKPMVSFISQQSVMSVDVPASSGREANTYTTFAVMKVKNGTTTDGNGTLINFYGSGTNNTRYAPFWRHQSSGVGSNQLCVARGTTERICQDYGSTISSSPAWTLWSGREALTEKDMLLRRNGVNSTSGQSQFYDAITLNAPYRIVLGGNASNLQARSDVEFAEVILFDRMLTCAQTESIELYLAERWGLTDTSLASSSLYASGGCAENNIPVY